MYVRTAAGSTNALLSYGTASSVELDGVTEAQVNALALEYAVASDTCDVNPDVTWSDRITEGDCPQEGGRRNLYFFENIHDLSRLSGFDVNQNRG